MVFCYEKLRKHKKLFFIKEITIFIKQETVFKNSFQKEEPNNPLNFGSKKYTGGSGF